MPVIIKSLAVPTPFGGKLHLPQIETPPLSLPQKPDSRGKTALGHSIGQDVADLAETVVSMIPPPFSTVVDFVRDGLTDLHAKEIKNTLNPQEYDRWLEYNKLMPSSVAMARVVLFKETETESLEKLKPNLPKDGPPVPQALNIKWPQPT